MAKLQYTQKEVLDKIPEDWSQITFDTYLNKLTKVKVIDTEDPLQAMSINIQLISIFLDLPENIIEQFPITLIKSISRKLSFLAVKPEPLKSSRYSWIRNSDEPTYDDFITFVKVSEQIQNGDMSNFPMIIKIILKDKLTDEQIMNLPMHEVEHGFFLLRKYLLKYLHSTTKDLTVKMIVLRTNELIDKMNTIQGMPFKKKLRVINEKFKELTVGTSLPKK